MQKHFKKRSQKESLPPGTLVYVGEKKVEKVIITVLDYDSERYEEKEFESIEECFPYKDSPSVTWINIDGIHQVEMMEKIISNKMNEVMNYRYNNNFYSLNFHCRGLRNELQIYA